MVTKTKYKLPQLGYSYDALEPYIDARTMEIHYTKHHQAYLDKFNAALEKHPKLQEKTPEEMLTNIEEIPEDIRNAVINSGGGYVNHSFFWNILGKGTEPGGEILNEIQKKFGSFENFKKEFSDLAVKVFGSGYVWLVLSSGELEIIHTHNQDSPLTDGKIPIITIDLWEHAYYLKYQNRRAEYIEAFFNVINWDKAEENYLEAKELKIPPMAAAS